MDEHDEHPSHVWNRRYAESGWSVVPDVSLVELITPLNPGRALDLGCGTGRNALWLARAGWEVTGVDASSVGLTMAREQAAREGLHLAFEEADLLAYQPSPEHYALVVIANIHLSPAHRDGLFDRAARAVAPSGHLYIIGHHVDAFGHHGPPFRERLYEESLFRDRFDDFTIEILERRERASDADDSPDVSVLLWAVKNAVPSEAGS